MPTKTTKRPYYSTALRAELEAMRLLWRSDKAPNSPRLTLRQLHALVKLERTWVEPERPGWYPEYYKDQAELQALFEATHPSWSNIRAQIHFAMKSNSCSMTITGPGGAPLPTVE